MADSSTEAATDGSSDHPNAPKGRAVLRGEADAYRMVESIDRAAHPRWADDLTDSEELDLRRKHGLPPLRLPGFGEPEDDCGEFVLPAMRFCVRSGKTHEFKHNCLRYDCPRHAPYAVRRRAAGSSDAAGIAPKLKSLLLRLYKARGEQNHYFHHLFVSIPDDYVFESESPLERSKEVLREIMDELGIQGVVGFHPYRGDKEDRFADDRGFWKDLLFHRSDWSDARDDLDFSPHFHIVGVAPHVDVSVTEEIERETGWVIHRRSDEDGRSIGKDYSKPDDTDDDAMCRALTYLLSHCGVYETETGQRRLAAWMKGPDVASTTVYPQVKDTMQQAVYEAAEDTLGIASPSLECDCDFHQRVQQVDPSPDDPDQQVESGAVHMRTDPGPVVVHGPGDRAGGPHWSGVGGMQSTGTDLPANDTGWAAFGDVDHGAGPSSGSAGSAERAAPRGDCDADDVDQESAPECGAYLKHISKAFDYLGSEQWRRNAPYADELEGAYRSYIDYMTAEDRNPFTDTVKLPEEADGEPPPVD